MDYTLTLIMTFEHTFGVPHCFQVLKLTNISQDIQLCHRLISGFEKIAVSTNIRFFFWLLLKDRLSTRDLLRRKGMLLQSHNCVLCNHHSDETLEHLFLLCPMAVQFWTSIGLLIPAFTNHNDVFISFKRQLNLPFFMEIIIRGCWSIWMVRNDFIFRNLRPSLQACHAIFKKEFVLALHRTKSTQIEAMKAWIDNNL